ncbi:Homoserine O-acetyltransferase [Pyrenophora tritici-repentis]|uniref:MET2, Homoserine acetyltransferase n=1 Tax=Pyrenophora tritici-repentis TaxID=45151 RepID=A0A2W1G6V3_9PLEO|nr:MET2, Homoserine acetyltransferase [Pyrenophora tritici-repentis]KAI0570082.1 Homoserine O-acetyltransferase [Pyrenophora tritici-repentis]KAI0571056.1 Homoserine O-acetyltransferase [Pyrenophora tritici-repentis]KAI0604757.1 Homoserine O-acetyltransferase [Pyrenophora tritici-repentis]KAI0617001.1 Homoserine O-acetyltransferase [Pyrenophora tritici-repentis]
MASGTIVDGANGSRKYRTLSSQPENPFAKLIPDQSFAVIPQVTLESGVVLQNVSVAYKTYGTLAPGGDNAMVICHALTGSADVGDWWGPLIGGPGKAFDISRFFVVCMNSLGSPYGSASPVTAKDGDASLGQYGPEFPLTTVRDDVNIFKLILDDLGVKQIAAVIGGSMGGMLVLEFAYFGKDYVKTIIPIATSARYSAWGISWGEAQRQSIYSDPKYDDGYYSYDDPPSTGLGAARMSALLTYRSRDSFESRFGRNTPDTSKKQSINTIARSTTPTNPSHEHWAIHNDGHKNARSPRLMSRTNSSTAIPGTTAAHADLEFHDASNPATPPLQRTNSTSSNGQFSRSTKPLAPHYFSAQSYLRYQGEKFIKRFDANCYIAITRKLDTHDISRYRYPEGETPETLDQVSALHHALSLIEQPTLVLGIQSDGLFTFAEQQELAAHIPHATLKTIDSPDGHDAFLLEFEQVNKHLVGFLNTELPEIINRTPSIDTTVTHSGMAATKTSTFGEAEVDDITAW